MKFEIEFTKKAIKELKSLPPIVQKHILEETIQLESNPFPSKTKIKKIKGIKFPCFRLRIDFQQNSYRVFYGIQKNVAYILRIVSKKSADKIIKNIRTVEFPPE